MVPKVDIIESGPAGYFGFRAIVRNQGAQGNESFVVAFQLDGKTIHAQTFPPGIPAGSNLTVDARTWGVGPGVHDLVVIADLNDDMPETDESNNGRTLAFTVPPPGVNLFVANLSAKESHAEMTTPASFLIGNSGSTPLPVNITLALGVDGVLSQRFIFGTGMPAGWVFNFSAILPALSLGPHTFDVVIDIDGNATETTLVDNAASVTFEVLPLPDLVSRVISLVPRTMDTPAGVLPHALGRYDAVIEICNVGAWSAPHTFVSTSVSGATTGVAGLASWSIPVVNVSACVTLSQTFDAPGVIGDFRFVVVAASDLRDASFYDNFAFANASRGVSGLGGIVAPSGARSQIVDESGPVATINNFRSILNATVTNTVVVIGTFAGSAPGAIESAVCASPNGTACEQFRGDYGAGALRGCREPSPNNLFSTLAYQAFHPADPRTGNPTGVDLCSPTPRDLLYEAADHLRVLRSP